MKMKMFLCGAVSVVALACGGGNEANAPHPADQVAWGQELYAKHCADCHGDQGQGHAHDNAPPVVGKEALPLDPPPTAKVRKAQFHTAKDVFDFVKATMPKGKAGSLTDEQYAAILAFDLKANGVDLAGKQLDATTAPTFVLHP